MKAAEKLKSEARHAFDYPAVKTAKTSNLKVVRPPVIKEQDLSHIFGTIDAAKAVYRHHGEEALAKASGLKPEAIRHFVGGQSLLPIPSTLDGIRSGIRQLATVIKPAGR